MDIKITGSRFKNLLSYEWVKIVISILAGVIVWMLLFTMLATRATIGEQFVFVVYENVYTQNKNKNNQLLENMKKDGVLSYDVLKTSVSPIMSAGQYSASYMLSLRATTQEGDVMLISDGRLSKVLEDGSDTESNSSSSMQSDPYNAIKTAINARYFYDINAFLLDAKEYCLSTGGGFITPNADGSYTVNKSAIDSYFRQVRMKSADNYHKTYRTEEQIKQAVELETKRITDVYENYLYLTSAIQKAKDNGADFLWYGDIYDYDENGHLDESKPTTYALGIDLYKLNSPFVGKEGSTVPKVEDTWFTYANGKTSSEGLVMCVFDFQYYQPDLQYESLAFLTHIVKTYSGY